MTRAAISQAAPAERHLRLLSCNILAGASVKRYREYVTRSLEAVLPGRNKLDNLDRLAEVLPQFDLIGLQEADAGSLRGMVEPDSTIAPYLGIGYGHVPREGLNFYFDLGVIYQGSGPAGLAGTCGASISSPQCAQYQPDVAAERYGLERSLDKYGLYPVGRVGISVGF